MPQRNSIDVEIYPALDAPEEPIKVDGVNYVSFISSPGGASGGTYGIPALLSEAKFKDEGLPGVVLYINPANVVAVKATRTA